MQPTVMQAHHYQPQLSYKDTVLEQFLARKQGCDKVQHRLCGHIPSFHATGISLFPLLCHKKNDQTTTLYRSTIDEVIICFYIRKSNLFSRTSISNQLYVSLIEEEWQIPLSKPRTSDAVELNSGGKLRPTTNEGRTVTRSIPFWLQKSHAALSASVFDKTYQILSNAPITMPRRGPNTG